jgi:putative transposase
VRRGTCFDRDGIYGEAFRDAAESLGIRHVLTSPQSPWQNPFVEWFIGSIRRECLGHVIIINGAGLRRVLNDYFGYYEHSPTHLSLGKDAPITRHVQPPSSGSVIEIPVLGGLHHRYERRAA